MTRILLASTSPGDWVLDPLAGSSTTGIAATLTGRRFLGIEREKEYVEMSKARRIELENINLLMTYRNKIKDIKSSEDLEPYGIICEDHSINELPF